VGEESNGTPNRTWLLAVSIISVQIGAGYAGRLMDDVGPAGVVVLRQGLAALVLLAVTRPRLRGRSRAQWRTIVAFGVILAVMNLTFYAAVERLPLGVAVTIELLGPLGLAAALSRRAVEFVWVGVAVVGVVMLGEGEGSLDPLGIVFVLIAAACWAAYIMVSRRAGQQSSGADSLALAMSIAALIAAPLGLRAGSALLDPHVLWIGLVVAVLAALVPFSVELVALRSVPPRVFGVLMSMSPVVATLSGFVLLDERLTAMQVTGMGVVIAASMATVLSNRSPAEETGAEFDGAECEPVFE
jgi:inner membrane transporter RhtA